MVGRFEVFRDKRGDWRWRFRITHGSIIADSGEGYHNKSDVINGIESVKENAPDAPVVELPEH